MASNYRNYDEQIMSAEDYARIQGYQNDYANATDAAGRQQAHQNAENLRAQYGYSMGTDGSQFSLINPRPGVSQDTAAQMLHWQNQANNPMGNSAFYQQFQSMIDQYSNRDPFTYDMASDGLYQQYADQYTRLGELAMEDTLGQAASLTGGYNSSFSQSAGQQAYQGYLDQLNDIVPELYAQARTNYNQEGQDMLQQAQLAAQGYGLESQNYWNNMNYWAQQAANEQNQYWQQQNYDQQQAANAVSQQQTAYGNLVTAISNTGYKPTDAELAAAGMSREEADQWANYYAANLAVKGSSGGSGGRSGGRSGSGRSSSSGSGSGGSSQSPAAQAGTYAATHSGYIDDDATQDYMDSLGLHGEARQQFVAGLLAAGWGYSWNTDINGNATNPRDYWNNR